MPSRSRRDFLRTGAAAAVAAGALPPALARALETPARRVHGTIQDVEHVVILMQENRAFDHYFGCLRGVRGYGDPRPLMLPSGRSVFHQPWAPGVEDALLPFRLSAEGSSAECMQSLDHSWKGEHSLWRNHDAWIAVKGPLTMGHFTREDIPFYYALADAFTICDAYHASIFGPTDPNRLFLFSGTSGLAAGAYGLHNVTNDDDGNETADAANDRKDFVGYKWTTYAERLQAAGVSWKVFQEYDNFSDNALAFFANFRGLDHASPLHQRGRTWVSGSTPENATESHGEHLITAFAEAVQADALPQVSWIVAPTKGCEHPDASPAYGEAFTAGVIEALASRPDVFAKTVFFLNYDENDGFFDHLPPPIPAIAPQYGASTVSTSGEAFGAAPVGLGPRVPMIVVSPWSRGGWVNSQLFDHTSVIRFLEARFGVAEPNITPWRRAVTGDLTSCFDFTGRAVQPPSLPSTADVVARVQTACKLGGPVVPKVASLPVQEAGGRPARPLPYALEVSATIDPATSVLNLRFENTGAAGACFSAHPRGAVAGPWSYTVEAGKSLTASLPGAVDADGDYALTVYGPNGFLRAFHGRGRLPAEAARPEVSLSYRPAARQIVLQLANTGGTACRLTVRPNAYGAAPARSFKLAPGQIAQDVWAVGDSACWYDLTVTNDAEPAYQRRLAGHMETGRPSFSDPALGTDLTIIA